jgi:hypothetical protein
MNWTFDRTALPEYIRITTVGEASLAGFVAMWEELLNCDFWRPGLSALFDNRNLTEPTIRGHNMTGGVDFFVQNADRIGSSCIVVVSEDGDRYMDARRFQYGVRLRGCDAILQVFDTDTNAVEWLSNYSRVK